MTRLQDRQECYAVAPSYKTPRKRTHYVELDDANAELQQNLRSLSTTRTYPRQLVQQPAHKPQLS